MLLVNTAVRVILRVGKLRAGSEMLGKIRHQSQRHMKSGNAGAEDVHFELDSDFGMKIRICYASARSEKQNIKVC